MARAGRYVYRQRGTSEKRFMLSSTEQLIFFLLKLSEAAPNTARGARVSARIICARGVSVRVSVRSLGVFLRSSLTYRSP